MIYNIIGDDVQAIEIHLKPNEIVKAEAGSMMYMQQNIQMSTTSNGGIGKAFKRVISGESLFVTKFENKNINNEEKVVFASPMLGRIIPINLQDFNGTFICQRDSYLCSTFDIDISAAFPKKITAGLFGGEGILLQKLSGNGIAFINACGVIVEKNLEAGEVLKVDTGCIVGFDSKVDYDVEFVKGFKTMLFGGEGLFIANLTGPGKVYLQSIPFNKLSQTICQKGGGVSSGSGEGLISAVSEIFN